MRFWVLENTVHDYVRIHLAECRYCNNGQGPRPGHRGNWTGFASYREALAWARSRKRRMAEGVCCHPERHAEL